MPSKSQTATKDTPSKPSPGGKKDRSKALKDLGASTSGIVQKAASVLEEEVAAGITAAREVEKGLRERDGFRRDQLEEVVQRLRKDAHDAVDIIGERMTELRSKETDELSRRFQQDAHDAVDVLLNLVGNAPDILNRVLNASAAKPDAGK